MWTFLLSLFLFAGVSEGNHCKMWTFLLSLYLFAGASAIEIDCDERFYDACRLPELFRRIPREVEEVDALCPEIPPYFECVLAYNRKCFMNERLEKFYTTVKVVVEEICEEGTSSNEIFTSNLKCFNETITNTNCVREREAFVKQLLKDSRVNHTIAERVHCLSVILYFECLFSDITRNCGLRAGNLTAEFFRRTLYLDGNCPSSFRENLMEDIDEFNLTEEQKTFAIAELRRLESSDNV